MIKINSDKALGVAWMLRYDGKEIPCKFHIYGYPGGLEENVGVAFFLIKHETGDIVNKANNFLKEFTAKFASDNIKATDDIDEYHTALKAELDKYPANLGYAVGLSKEQVADYLIKLIAGMDVDSIIDIGLDVEDDAGDFLNSYLNENYIRVRMNNEYNAASYNGVGYFRIGSTYRNWTNPIYMFVHDHSEIKTVVVERDMESDDPDYQGSSERNVMINNMSREEFLSAEKLPFLGCRQRGLLGKCYELIQNNKHSEIESLNANRERIAESMRRLKSIDIRNNYPSMVAPWADSPKNR